MECITLDNQPLSFVEDIGFRRILDYIEPRYPVPSRRYFYDGAIPELQVVLFNTIEKLIDSGTWVSFTTDIWTSCVTPLSMLSLMAQWVGKNF